MNEPLWEFEGYTSPAGNNPVQDWYHDELSEDERDLIRDRINHLKDIERHLWRRPGFDKLEGELNEIRKDTPDGTIRIYGNFHPEKRHCFVLLEGRYKDKKNDKAGKAIAQERLKLLKQRKGRTHEFNFEERSTPQNPPGQEG